MGKKLKLKIEWSHDEYECDDCGTSWATGATAYLDGVKIVDKQASAHCYGGSGSDSELAGILAIALEKLGVEIEDEESDIQWYKESCYDFENTYDGINFIKL